MTVSANSNGRDVTTPDAADESTPLLSAPTGRSAGDASNAPADDNGTATFTDGQKNSTKNDEAYIPYGQVLLICYASLADPVIFFAILPFINEMIQRTGNVDEADVGFWSGMIESLFSIVQITLVFFYGRLSDRIGRKPVLVSNLIGLGITSSLFGLSQTLWQMIMFRLLAGLFGGTIVTARLMLAENTTKATQGRVFSWYMFVKNFGGLVGPLLGGVLANPAVQFPSMFRGIAFFETYPYALATIVPGALSISAALLSFLFLKETFVCKDSGDDQAKVPTSTWGALQTTGVGIVLFVVGHVAFLSLAYTTVTPVFLFVRADLGGCGLTSDQISYFLSISAASQAFWILLVFPPLQRAVGTGNVLRISAVVWTLFMAMFPIISELFRHNLRTWPWAVAIPTLILGSSGAMSFASTQLCVNDVSPSPSLLGTINAMALVVACGVRAVAPALFNSIFAFGIKSGWAHGQLVWFILILLAVSQMIPLQFLPKAVDGRVKKVQPQQGTEESMPDDVIVRPT